MVLMLFLLVRLWVIRAVMGNSCGYGLGYSGHLRG